MCSINQFSGDTENKRRLSAQPYIRQFIFSLAIEGGKSQYFVLARGRGLGRFKLPGNNELDDAPAPNTSVIIWHKLQDRS